MFGLSLSAGVFILGILSFILAAVVLKGDGPIRDKKVAMRIGGAATMLGFASLLFFPVIFLISLVVIVLL